MFKTISYKEAIGFLLPRHYSGRKPSITFSFGYLENNELKAVCTFGKPASNSLCVGVCGKEYSEKLNYKIETYPKGENKKYKLGGIY